MKCKGICYRYAAKRPSSGYRFMAGQRPCSICGIFVDINLFPVYRCPCCNNKLRLSSRNARSRKNRFNILHKSNLLGKASEAMKSLTLASKTKDPIVVLPKLK
ncbi:MAG: hypothetical protein ACREA3_08060 [Nitrosotalea sp.]